MAEAQIFRGVDRLKLIAMIVGSKVSARTACACWKIYSGFVQAGHCCVLLPLRVIQHSERLALPRSICAVCMSVIVVACLSTMAVLIRCLKPWCDIRSVSLNSVRPPTDVSAP
jgi:hypothetical protein